jgi:hypothetical protein
VHCTLPVRQAETLCVCNALRVTRVCECTTPTVKPDRHAACFVLGHALALLAPTCSQSNCHMHASSSLPSLLGIVELLLARDDLYLLRDRVQCVSAAAHMCTLSSHSPLTLHRPQHADRGYLRTCKNSHTPSLSVDLRPSCMPFMRCLAVHMQRGLHCQWLST